MQDALLSVEKEITHVKNNQKIHADKIISLEIKISEIDHKFDKRLTEHETGRTYDREKLNAIDENLKEMSRQLMKLNNAIISDDSEKKQKAKSFENLKWFLAVILASGVFDVIFHCLGWK